MLCDSAWPISGSHLWDELAESRSSVTIVSPTYNECENITSLIKRISDTMLDRDYEIILVDDNSTDGTATIAMNLSKKYPIKVLMRDKKSGLASAILTGFEHARGDIIGVIDADLQHPPESIIECVEALDVTDCEIAIGSRYVKGGGVEGWSRSRLITSKIAIWLAKPLVRNVKDPMSGFFFMKRKVIENIALNPMGYKLGLEVLLKGNYEKVVEIPYIFKKRQQGVSKLNKKEIFLYLKLLASLYKYKIKRWMNSGRYSVPTAN